MPSAPTHADLSRSTASAGSPSPAWSTATPIRPSAATARASSTCAPRAPTTSASTPRAAGLPRRCAATRRLGREGIAAAVRRHLGWMARARHDHGRGQVRLRARPRHRAREPGRDRGAAPDRGGADVPGRPLRAGRVRRRRRVPRLRHRRGAARGGAQLPRPPTCSSSAGPSAPSRPSATCGRPPGTAWRCGSTATSSPSRARSSSPIELGARSVDHLEATGPARGGAAGRERRRRRAAAGRGPLRCGAACRPRGR